jgi:hypothetical protein
MSMEQWIGGAYGKRLDADWPENQLAELDVEHKASPEKVERARLLFKEARLDDFEPLGSKGRRFRHRETGREYVTDESQVLMAGDPRAGGVEFFAIDGYRIVFLRPRDFDPVQRVVLGTLVAGELTRRPGGDEVLVPSPTALAGFPELAS